MQFCQTLFVLLNLSYFFYNLGSTEAGGKSPSPSSSDPLKEEDSGGESSGTEEAAAATGATAGAEMRLIPKRNETSQQQLQQQQQQQQPVVKVRPKFRKYGVEDFNFLKVTNGNNRSKESLIFLFKK